MGEKLTDEQIANWRKVLINLIGPWALIIPDAEVQRIHDKMQERIEELEADVEVEP